MINSLKSLAFLYGLHGIRIHGQQMTPHDPNTAQLSPLDQLNQGTHLCVPWLNHWNQLHSC